MTIRVKIDHPNGDKASYNGGLTGFLGWLMDCGVIKKENITIDYISPYNKEEVHKNLLEWKKNFTK